MAEINKVVTDDFSMEYFSFGKGDKTLVLIPGITIKSVMEAAEAVEGTFESYLNDWKVYVFDPPEDLPEDYSLEDIAADTAKAIWELGLSDINLFGASMGGMIAMVIAMEHPELVRKLILASTSSHVKPEQQAIIDKWTDLAQAKDVLALCRNYAADIYPEQVYEQNKAYFDDMAGTVTDNDLRRFITLGKAIKKFNVTDGLKKIKCPTLVTGAYEDIVLDDDATMEIAEKLDNRSDFRLHMYTGYGHAAFDLAPDYRQRMMDFLNTP